MPRMTPAPSSENSALSKASNRLKLVEVDIQKFNRIQASDKLSPATKRERLNELQVNIQRNLAGIDKLLNDEKNHIHSIFNKIKQSNPHANSNNHPVLKQFKAQYQQIISFGQKLNHLKTLCSLKAPMDDPLLASMPKTPQDKPLMTKEWQDHFIQLASKKLWVQVDAAIAAYAKENKLPYLAVKSQVIDVLLNKRLSQVFNNQFNNDVSSVEVLPSNKKMK